MCTIYATVEEAINNARAGGECQIEWYGLGKTNKDLIEYLKCNGIDERELGVFIAGSIDNNPAAKLTFMPLAFVDLCDSGHSR